MSKDVILDKYARLYEIPNQLALLGHKVECFCLSYQSHADGVWNESDENKHLIWSSKCYLAYQKIKILSYPIYILKKLEQFQPDIVISASDIPHIVLGAWCAKKLNKPFVADLYDNFESYDQAKIPFIKILYHHALDSAQLISTTSHSLAGKVKQDHPDVPFVLTMPSVIDKKIFFQGNKVEARQKLQLPIQAKLIGTAGSLTKAKGINDLFNAWEVIRQQSSDVYLVLAGSIEESTRLPDDNRVIYLGLLPHSDVNYLFQALDIGILCIPDDDFGRYCFPQKAYEMLATNLTIISTNIGDMKNMLEQNLLYDANDFESLAFKINEQLTYLTKVNVDIPNWKKNLKIFNSLMRQI
jgi:glycosyltransferase involved in cell wall biosynthesis